MCKAFSCIIGKDMNLYWKLGIDSHSELIDMSPYSDNMDCKKFVRIEITPDNNDYLFPNKWTLKIDSEKRPRWFSPAHETECMKAQNQWQSQLDKILVHKKIVHPFNDIVPPKCFTKKIKRLLYDWDSVGDSVWDSVGDSVGNSVWGLVGNSVRDSVGNSIRDSVWDSVGNSVWGSVRDSVGGSVWDSVRDSVGGYTGSFFKIQKWKYIQHKKGAYPYQSVVKLWMLGLVPSFDGEIWRLHGGHNAKILFEISKKDLKKYK